MLQSRMLDSPAVAKALTGQAEHREHRGTRIWAGLHYGKGRLLYRLARWREAKPI